MGRYRLGCCIPGASFMPEGEAGIKRSALELLSDGCEAIIGAGFDYAETGVGMVMSMTEAEMEKAAAAGLPIETANSFIPPEYKIVADGACEVGSPLYEYVDKALSRMAALGIKIVVFGSGGARRIPDGMATDTGRAYIAKFLSMCADIGDRCGVTVAIEPLRASECNAINLTSTAAELAGSVGRERVSYLADAFHMYHGGEPADALLRASVLPVHIHVSEPPDRTYPGSHGGEYIAAFADALGRTEYRGRVSVECGFSDFRREVRLAHDFMKAHF